MALSEDRCDSVGAVEERVGQALTDGEVLSIAGGQTKKRLGRRSRDATRLDLSAMDQLVSYEPGELVLVAQPGMRLAAVEDLLRSENQHLAFEPPHWGASATLGGMMATGLSGPRRFKAGAVRDFVLGVEVVDGRGQRLRAGGRVVKNVTGYDLSRTLCGSFGTLGALTEICIKLWPRPETQQTLVVHGLRLQSACRRMLDWAGLQLEITGLAFLPSPSASRLLARIEGPESAVSLQIARLAADEPEGETSILEDAESTEEWRLIRELEPLKATENQQLWRFVQPQDCAVRLVEQLQMMGLERYTLDWSGGQLWAVLPGGLAAAELHGLASQLGAWAWRLACGSNDDNDIAMTPLEPGARRLNDVLLHAMNPDGVFDAGRMFPELNPLD